MERVIFDTWAWFEIFAESAVGRRLSQRYLDDPDVRVLTPSLALAEMSSKMARRGHTDRIPATLAAMDAGSEIVHLSTAAAIRVGPILVELRKSKKEASTADAVMLATARDHAAKLVSNDRAYAAQDDVVHS